MDRHTICKLLFLLFNVHVGSSVIYNLKSTEYELMPPVFYLEPYENCMEEPDAVYCVTELVPVSDTPNKLIDTIREYSAHTPTHFNHSLNRYGICLSSCKHAKEIPVELRYTLEACLNETYWRKHGLKTNLQEYVRCHKAQKEIFLETTDIIFFVVFVFILLINIVGSVYDVYATSLVKDEFGLQLLSCFSIRQNWRKLMAPAADCPEPRLKDLRGIIGPKLITTILVIVTHSLIAGMVYIENAHFVEEYYKNYIIQLILNGTLVIQTFFILSGFLLVYNLLLFSEHHTVGWSMLPIGIFLRWIRLTPPYALLLLFTITWMRFSGSGPAWDIAVTDEVNDCKKYWWQHLFYINNYNNESQCFLHTWYLAADTQLYCLGLVVFIACKSPTSRKVVITLLLLIGLVIPPLLTYLKDLDGVVILSPETINHFFINDLNYYYLYKSMLPNIFHYTIGLATGFLVYHLQEIHFDVQKYKEYRYLAWCLVAMGFGTVWTGCIFYWDGPRQSLLVRLAYATFLKSGFSCMLMLEFLILIFRFEPIQSFIMETHVGAVLGRLSYSSYLLHVTLQRIILGTHKDVTHVTILNLTQQAFSLVFVSYLAAVPYWLLVEQPLGQLIKVFVRPEKKIK